jgi:CO/xanthine dehydrogenase FAD-binding subunit
VRPTAFGRPLAGGQSLVPMMNLRLARPAHLVDIGALALNEIVIREGHLHVGALVRHQQYFESALIARHFPAFRDAVSWIGHPTIRRHGTLGGSISHADPTAELPAMCVLHDATIHVRSQSGARAIAAADFFISAYVTALEPGEMVVGVDFPLPRETATGAFVELGERRGDFAIASVGITIDHDGRVIEKARIVCSGAKLVPLRATEAEAAFLVGKPLSDPTKDEAARLFGAGLSPVHDHAASAAYRKALITQLTERAIACACKRALTQ